jgi:succinate dehydrogenase hydrophobic anchor subunit
MVLRMIVSDYCRNSLSDTTTGAVVVLAFVVVVVVVSSYLSQ